MGTERTGTIPFMAVALLEQKYWDGMIKREYRHELESFIWILAFVCLRYKDGKAQSGTLVNVWMTANFRACRKKKIVFWRSPTALREMIDQVQAGFKNEWTLARQLVVHANQSDFHVESQIEKAFDDPSLASSLSDFSRAWNTIVDKLKESVKGIHTLDYVEELVQELGLEKLIPDANNLSEAKCISEKVGHAEKR